MHTHTGTRAHTRTQAHGRTRTRAHTHIGTRAHGHTGTEFLHRVSSSWQTAEGQVKSLGIIDSGLLQKVCFKSELLIYYKEKRILMKNNLKCGHGLTRPHLALNTCARPQLSPTRRLHPIPPCGRREDFVYRALPWPGSRFPESQE